MYPRFAIFCWAPQKPASEAEMSFLSSSKETIQDLGLLQRRLSLLLLLLLDNDSRNNKKRFSGWKWKSEAMVGIRMDVSDEKWSQNNNKKRRRIQIQP